MLKLMKSEPKDALSIMLVGLCLVVFFLVFFIVEGRLLRNTHQMITERDTITYVDTIPYYMPVAKDSAVIRYVTRNLPIVKPQSGKVQDIDNPQTTVTDTFLSENSRTAVLRLHSAEHVQAQLCSRLHEDVAQNNGENIPPQELSDERDSMAVEIPITQKRYDGEDYRAYVSGYEPNLDSIFVFPKTTVIHERSYKPPNKWHIGITGGYGYGFKSKQAEPYVGIGIMYSVFSF